MHTEMTLEKFFPPVIQTVVPEVQVGASKKDLPFPLTLIAKIICVFFYSVAIQKVVLEVQVGERSAPRENGRQNVDFGTY